MQWLNGCPRPSSVISRRFFRQNRKRQLELGHEEIDPVHAQENGMPLQRLLAFGRVGSYVPELARDRGQGGDVFDFYGLGMCLTWILLGVDEVPAPKEIERRASSVTLSPHLWAERKESDVRRHVRLRHLA